MTGLLPRTAYQVRVSHPSTIPADVAIRVEDGRHAASRGRTDTVRPGGRSLLDTTRAPLRVGGGADDAASPTITINITATSKGYYAPGLGPPTALPVAITVQPLVAGLMPADCGRVIAASACLLVGVLLCVPWWAAEGVGAVGAWLDGGGEGGGEEMEERRGQAGSARRRKAR